MTLTDTQRLDYLEKLMTPANKIYLAGLRRSIELPATSFQVELQNKSAVSGLTLREVIDNANLKYPPS